MCLANFLPYPDLISDLFLNYPMSSLTIVNWFSFHHCTLFPGFVEQKGRLFLTALVWWYLKDTLNIFYILFYGEREREREKEMFYLTTHSTHFIYRYMASDIWLRTILIVRKETRCRHIGYSYLINSKGSFISHHPTDRITHTTWPLLHQLWSKGWNEI